VKSGTDERLLDSTPDQQRDQYTTVDATRVATDNTSAINFANKMIYGYCARKCRNVDILYPAMYLTGRFRSN